MSPGDSGKMTPNPLRLMAELEFLNELCQVVASSTELQPILDWIVQKTTTMLTAEEGSIHLIGDYGEEMTLRTLIRKKRPGISSGSWPPRISQAVMGYLVRYDEPLATPDLVDDARFPGLKKENTRIRSVLAVPLKVEKRFTGMLSVTQAVPGRRWKQDEIQLLSIVASNSAGVLEQARLRQVEIRHRELEEERRQRERELGVAREIQMSLLPPAPLRIGRWEIFGRVVPAREVGGDSFDYFPIGDGRVALAIADVSGKGVPAAILMSNLQASLRAFCNGAWAITEALDRVNKSVMRTAASGKFATLFYAEFDSVRGLLRYSNAGHNYPLLRRRDGSLNGLAEGGPPLGVLENVVYGEGELPMAPGDSLLLYSDGIIEATDPLRRQFGEDRLRALWQRCGDREPSQVIEYVLGEVEAFRGHAHPSDDMTLVVLDSRRGG